MNRLDRFEYKILFLCADIFAVFIAGFTSLWVRFYSGYFIEVSGLEIIGKYYNSFLVIIPVSILINIILGLYKKYIEVDFINVIKNVFIADLFFGLTLTGIMVMAKQSGIYSRLALFFLIIFSFLYHIIFRFLIRSLIVHYLKKSGDYKIVILGTGKLAKLYAEEIKKYEKFGYVITGFLTPRETIIEHNDLNGKLLGTFYEFSQLQQKYNFDEVVVALHIDEASYIKEIIKLCDLEGIRIKIIPGFYEYMKYSTYIEDLNGMPVLTVRGIPLDKSLNRFIKRIFDILVSLVAFLLLWPVFLVIAVIQKIKEPKENIFFAQERIGINNKKFKMYKFRSMKTLAPDEEKTKWSTQNDPRITKFGEFLRRTNLDELPQFYNVLKGDMSVVGPRPERPYWVGKFKDDVPHYMLRHYVKSGITGWAQVNGFRGDTSIPKRIEYDNYYIRNWSLIFDIYIIFLTIFGKKTNNYYNNK